MKNKIGVTMVILLLLLSCDGVNKIVCGEPGGRNKAFIDKINTQHSGTLIVEQIPCYPGYLQVNCKAAVTNELLDEIDASARKLDWIEVLVYDKDNKLIRGNKSSM